MDALTQTFLARAMQQLLDEMPTTAKLLVLPDAAAAPPALDPATMHRCRQLMDNILRTIETDKTFMLLKRVATCQALCAAIQQCDGEGSADIGGRLMDNVRPQVIDTTELAQTVCEGEELGALVDKLMSELRAGAVQRARDVIEGTAVQAQGSSPPQPGM